MRQRKSITHTCEFYIPLLGDYVHLSTFVEMDATKRRAMIKSQAAKWKEGGQVPKGMDQSRSSSKRKVPSKQDRLPKRTKVTLEPIVGLEDEGTKTVATAKHGVGKGFMKGSSTSKKKPPVLLREDCKYALERLSYIITKEDYEDLGNHSMEVIGETRLFGIT